MYKLVATIQNIQTNQNLNIVTFDFQGQTLSMVSLDLSADVQIGREVLLNIKANSVALGKNISGELSYSNQIDVEITEIEYGDLLCNVKLACGDAFFESIITQSSAQRMDLQKMQKVTALIKANEISIAEVLH